MKDFLSVKSMGRTELEGLIDAASELRTALDDGAEIAPSLAGLCVANVFFEPSTRTRLSFDLAAQRLGGHVITFDPETASTAKGETLRDTVLTLSSIGADVLVVRHGTDGVPASVADWTGLPVINAGDGTNEHPTQAVLDAVTIGRHYEAFEGLSMAIVGDVAHSRVAGSLLHAMPLLGVRLSLVGPAEWLPEVDGPSVSLDLDQVLADLDIVYLLRVQTERGGIITDEYVDRFQLNASRSARLKPDAVVMHPGPMNRGVEIVDEVAESPRSLVTEQVRNGVPSRMAILRALAGSHS
jgi:aspartate carbamoyltransferase catalytic subunit